MMKLCVVVVCTSVVVLPVFVEMLPNQLGKGAAAIAAPCYTRETGCGGVQSLTPLNYDSGIGVNIAEERKNNEAEEEEERLAFIPGASTTRVLPAKGLSVHSLIHAPWVPAGVYAPSYYPAEDCVNRHASKL